MPILFSKHLCVSAALSLPRHSWRSDRHGESVGQQPWNKYGWSWVRWARIICFAICLCESVDVMTIVLPSPVSPQLLGRHLTDAHTFLRPTKSHTCKCMYTLIHTHTKTLFIVNCSHTSIYTQVHIYNSTAVASSISSGTKPWLLCVCVFHCPAYSVSIWPTVPVRNDELTIARQDWCWWLFSWHCPIMWQSVRVSAWRATWVLCSQHFGHWGEWKAAPVQQHR